MISIESIYVVTKAGINLPSIITCATNVPYNTGFKVHNLYWAYKTTHNFGWYFIRLKGRLICRHIQYMIPFALNWILFSFYLQGVTVIKIANCLKDDVCRYYFSVLISVKIKCSGSGQSMFKNESHHAKCWLSLLYLYVFLPAWS